MMIEHQLLSTLDLLLCIIQPLLHNLLGLSASFVETFLEGCNTRSIHKHKVAIYFIIVNLLPALNIDIEEADLDEENDTFPRFMISMSFPL